jgi:PAS domain S-box-containing protein
MRDVTSRRNAERALRQSEELFRAAFDGAVIGMMLVEPDGSISRPNPALCALLGYDESELRSLNVRDLTHPDDGPATEEAFRDLHAGRSSYYATEKRYFPKHGDPIWVQIAAAPVREADGRLRGFVTQVLDLTPLHLAEQKFRMVFEASGIGISIGSGGMLTETNPAYQRLIGYSGDELSRMHYSEITHPDDLDLDTELMAEMARGERQSFTIEKRYVRRDGTTLWVRVTVSMAPDGSFGIGLIEDVSERRRLLARTVEAAENERMAVAADLHDGPIQHLTATALALDLLANRLSRAGGRDGSEELVQRVRRDLAAEIASLRRLMTELRPPVIDERGIEAALRDCAARILGGAPIECSVDSNLGRRRLNPEVETAIYRVVREALTNIREHAHATHATVDLQARRQTVSLVVADDGTGFDPGRTVHGHFGLITMRERTESLGGAFTVSGGPGGTIVRAVLPLK